MGILPIGKIHMIVGIMWIFSAVCQIIALVYFAVNYHWTYYHWTYYLGWAGAVFEIIGGGLFLLWGRV